MLWIYRHFHTDLHLCAALWCKHLQNIKNGDNLSIGLNILLRSSNSDITPSCPCLRCPLQPMHLPSWLLEISVRDKLCFLIKKQENSQAGCIYIGLNSWFYRFRKYHTMVVQTLFSVIFWGLDFRLPWLCDFSRVVVHMSLCATIPLADLTKNSGFQKPPRHQLTHEFHLPHSPRDFLWTTRVPTLPQSCSSDGRKS